MGKLTRLLMMFVAFSCALVFCATAYADDGTAALPALTGWTGLALLATTAAAFFVRRLAPSVHFFQSAGGAFVIALIMAVLNAVAVTIQAHGLDVHALQASIMGAVFSLIATSNPTMGAAARDVSQPPEVK